MKIDCTLTDVEVGILVEALLDPGERTRIYRAGAEDVLSLARKLGIASLMAERASQWIRFAMANSEAHPAARGRLLPPAKGGAA